MDIHVLVSLSAETLAVLKSFVSGVAVKTAEPTAEKVKKEKAAAPAKEVKAEDNGKAETKTPAVDLPTIRLFVSKSEANKANARALFKKYETPSLSELKAEDYENFYHDLVNGEKQDDL